MTDTLPTGCCMSSLTVPASTVICTANGGKIDNNPCNILSPVASKAQCAIGGGCTKSKDSVIKTSGIGIVGIILAIIGAIITLVIFVGVYAWFTGAGSTPSVGGGIKKLFKTKLFK